MAKETAKNKSRIRDTMPAGGRSTASDKTPSMPLIPNQAYGLTLQGWWGLVLWLSFGLLLEGMIGYRTPIYLQDTMRRELFRLAHAHGTVFSVLLLVSAVSVNRNLVNPPNLALLGLQVGTLIMPLGFLLGGVWHTETDPNLFILLSPIGGLLIIFAVISIAFSVKKN